MINKRKALSAEEDVMNSAFAFYQLIATPLVACPVNLQAGSLTRNDYSVPPICQGKEGLGGIGGGGQTRRRSKTEKLLVSVTLLIQSIHSLVAPHSL